MVCTLKMRTAAEIQEETLRKQFGKKEERQKVKRGKEDWERISNNWYPSQNVRQ